MGGGLGNWEMRFLIYIVLDENVLDLLSNLRFKFTPFDLIFLFSKFGFCALSPVTITLQSNFQ